MKEMYIVKVLHHPDVLLLPSKSTIHLSKNEKIHLTFHKTFVQGILEYFGDPEYDVTPYNQISFVVTSIPPGTIPLKIAVELIKKASTMNHGDELVNILFDRNANVMAKLTILVSPFTFDTLDPRNPEHWDEIASKITKIELEHEEKAVDAVFLWRLKHLLENKDPEFQNLLKLWEIKEEEISRVREFIDLLMLLSDDFVTAMLNKKLDNDFVEKMRVVEDLWWFIKEL